VKHTSRHFGSVKDDPLEKQIASEVRNYRTGYETPVAERIMRLVREAIAAEREACAQIAATMGGDFIECDAHGDGYLEARKHIAAAIRARGEKKVVGEASK